MKQAIKSLPIITIFDSENGSEKKCITLSYVKGALMELKLLQLQASRANDPVTDRINDLLKELS